jgi:hypothetical protein
MEGLFSFKENPDCSPADECLDTLARSLLASAWLSDRSPIISATLIGTATFAGTNGRICSCIGCLAEGKSGLVAGFNGCLLTLGSLLEMGSRFGDIVGTQNSYGSTGPVELIVLSLRDGCICEVSFSGGDIMEKLGWHGATSWGPLATSRELVFSGVWGGGANGGWNLGGEYVEGSDFNWTALLGTGTDGFVVVASAGFSTANVE